MAIKKIAIMFQVAGFFPCLISLFFLGWLQTHVDFFVQMFAVHLFGDVLFFLDDTNGGKDA